MDSSFKQTWDSGLRFQKGQNSGFRFQNRSDSGFKFQSNFLGFIFQKALRAWILDSNFKWVGFWIQIWALRGREPPKGHALESTRQSINSSRPSSHLPAFHCFLKTPKIHLGLLKHVLKVFGKLVFTFFGNPLTSSQQPQGNPSQAGLPWIFETMPVHSALCGIWELFNPYTAKPFPGNCLYWPNLQYSKG